MTKRAKSGQGAGKKPRPTTAALRVRIVPYLQMGWSYEQIAPLFGKAPGTIKNWAQHPDVVAALGAVSDHVMEQTKERATDLAGKAWDTLERLMDHAEDERVQLEAAKTTLSRRGEPEATKSEATVEQTGGPQVVVQMTREEARREAKG